MMELDFDDSLARGLHRYVRMVSQALGLRGDCSCVQAEEPISAYLALDGRFSRFPDRDVALLWEESRGWSAAIESGGGDLHVVACLGQELLPPPAVVASWTRRLFRSHQAVGLLMASAEKPGHRDAATMRQRLATYELPELPERPLVTAPGVRGGS
jgi:uncharacterized protein DUF6292